ncbi:MAG: heme exporter protein CcmD [Proteobacteria bacterium]|nr:MAG: heme exporter protein CcmD [Pseudomonadota bacterium]
MGGYAFYVWSSYGAALLILGGIAIFSMARARQASRRLEELKRAAPHRRRREEAADGA